MPYIRLLKNDDLQQVNGIISRAFTQGRIDDGYSHSHVPMCRPEFLKMYQAQCPQGCFVLEEAEQIRGAAFCHVWGKTGWIGPLAIAPEKHHLGLGKNLAQEAIRFLQSSGCKTIGLETNPRSNRNIGFYGKLNFIPSVLSIDMIKPVSPVVTHSQDSPHRPVFFSRLSGNARQNFYDHMSYLARATSSNIDYSPVVNAIDLHRQGESIIFIRKGTPVAMAILQTEPSLVDEQNALLRVIAFVAHPKTPDQYFQFFLSDLLWLAKQNARDRILIRLPLYFYRGFRILLANNYRVISSDLRMVLAGYPDSQDVPHFHFNRWV